MARRDLTGAVGFDRLEAYAAGDQAVVDEVLAIFREQSELWLRLLDPASPLQAWRDAAHTMKGAASGIGADELAAACLAAETAPADPREREMRLERLRDALDRALLDIAAYVHEQALRSLKASR